MAANGLRYALLTMERGYEPCDDTIDVDWLKATSDAEAVAEVAYLGSLREGRSRLLAVAYEIEGTHPLVGDEIKRRAQAEHEKRVAQEKRRAAQVVACERAEYERLRAKFGDGLGR